MKKFWLIILGLCSIFFVWSFTLAKEYEYDNLNITADVLIDWTMNVKEDFSTYFFAAKHGIIRDIPLNYSVNWYKFHINVSDFNVEWKNFTTSNNNWNIEIKIWDANKTIVWRQNYPISYSTYGLIRNFSGMWYAELYWNLVGYGFDTNINKVNAVINLPKTYTWLTKDDFLITTDWRSKTIDGFEGSVDWGRGDRVIITYDKKLPAYQWITLAIKFPNNYFEFDHERQASLWWNIGPSFWDSLGNRLVIFTAKAIKRIFASPITFILLLIGFYFLIQIIKRKINRIRYKRGGNLRWKFAKKFPVIIQYNPPDWLSSAEVSLLLNRRAEPISLISLIYKRAAEGLISIKTTYKKDNLWEDTKKIKSTIIERLKEIDKSAPAYEKKFFKSLCSSKKKTISNSWDINMSISKLKSLEKYWTDNGWITPHKNTNILKILPRILAFICIPSFIILLCIFPLWIISFPLFIFLIILSNSYYYKIESSNKLTESWAELLSHILWYRKFLVTCDEKILRTFLKKDPLFLNKTLPYATVFGIDSELINKILPIMQDLDIIPNWYDSDLNNFDHLVSRMNDYTPSMPSRSANTIWWSWWASYSSSSWWSGWSSFGWWGGGWWDWFSSWWGWGWWGGRSW